MAYTLALKCLLLKVTFTNRTSSIPESLLSHMVSCDWPVRTQKHATLLITNMERSSERWSDEKVFISVDLLESYECLCDVTHTSYKNRIIKTLAVTNHQPF